MTDPGTPSFVDLPPQRVPVRTTTDVLVVGGGSAGAAAAIAAARGGARVVLAERGNYLGGLATGGLIILLLTMDDGSGRPVIGGICQETVDRLAARGAAYFPPAPEWGRQDDELVARYRTWGLVNGHAPHNVRYAVAYNAEEMKWALERMCAESGVQLLYSAWGGTPLVDGDRLRGVVFQAKDGRFAILANVVIDTTGDLDLLAAAGCAHEREKVAPWLWFTMGGVREEAAVPRAGQRFFRTLGKGHVLLPWGATERVARFIDATDTTDITYAATACRDLVMAEVDRLRREEPGFEDAYLSHVADQLDVTESRRLNGMYVLTREDLDQEFDDCIAVTGNWTKYDCVYNVPFRSLVPLELSNALTAGRSISVDHRVHHATKEIPACMATGEAAGAAAALALSHKGDVKAVDPAQLQRALSSAGAIIRRHSATGSW